MARRQDIAARIVTWRHPVLRRLSFLLLMPFLCLTLLEAGIMPVRDAAGHVSMVLCGSDLPVPMVVAPDGTVTPASEADRHAACVWAPHGQALQVSGPAAVLPEAASVFHRDEPAPEPAAAPRRVAAIPNLARGPPATI